MYCCCSTTPLPPSLPSHDDTAPRRPLPPPPRPPLPQPTPAPAVVDELNARFHRLPFRAGLWHSPDGRLSDAAVLAHVFDGWEDQDKPWLFSGDQSASLVHAGQGFPGGVIPIFNNRGCGLILRPNHTFLRCGKCGDSGGHCEPWCSNSTLHQSPEEFRCVWPGCAWPVHTFGRFLRHQARSQVTSRSLYYNEIIIDGDMTRAHAPGHLDAFFCTTYEPPGSTEWERARQRYARFLHEYGENATAFVQFDLHNWRAPFSPYVV